MAVNENRLMPNICMWGQAKSGKTTFLGSALTMLVQRLNAPKPDARFLVEPQEDERSAIAFQDDVMNALRNGEMPGANLPGSFDPFSLRIQLNDHNRSGRYGRLHTLRLADIAGEYMMALLDTLSENDPRSLYWKQMRQANGIIFVVDIDRPNRSTYIQLIDTFINNLQGRFEDKFLAICITKADIRFPERQEALRVASDQTKLIDLLAEAMGGNYYGDLAARFPGRNKIFLTSSAGWFVNEQGVWRPNISIDEVTQRYELPNPVRWQSFQTVHALLWLFDQLETSQIHSAKLNPFFKNLTLRSRVSNVELLRRQYIHEVEFP